ncbi:COMT [Symbiodinium sp. CCMP2592]|nr:COMT [Symbiodinium sp. CCMP2592]
MFASVIMCLERQPLLYAVTTAVQQRLGESQLQSSTKIAWCSVVLLAEPRQLYPMLETTLSAVRRQPADMSSPSAHALLWCVWTTAFPQHPGRLFKEWLQRGIDLGDMSTAVEVLLADSEWRRDQDEDLTWIGLLQHTSRPGPCQEVIRKYSCGRELPGWFRVQDGPWSKSKVSKNKPELAKYMQRFANLEKFAQPASGNHWEKLGAVIDFVEHRLSTAAPQVPDTVNEMLRLLDSFAQRREHWLKVAGGAKAEVLLHTYGLRTWQWHEVAVECGTFIGYSAMRLALQMLAGLEESPDRAGPRVFTIEVDPVQACIARHLVDLAGVSCSVEVATGQVRDVVPKIVELFGAASVGMVFMDYKGTAFHSDLDILEDTGALGIDSRLLADNVALPGAPLLLWNLAFSPSWELTAFAMTEFHEPNTEDWMALGRYCGPAGPAPAAPASWQHLSWHTDHMRRRACGLRPTEGDMFEADRVAYSRHVRRHYNAAGIQAVPWHCHARGGLQDAPPQTTVDGCGNRSGDTTMHSVSGAASISFS